MLQTEYISTAGQGSTQPAENNSAALQDHLKKILKLQKDVAQTKSILEKLEKIGIPNL